MTAGASGGSLDTAIVDLRARLAAAQRVAVLTGAGMSAESGVPTFRDALTGHWAKHDPQKLATVEGFEADPALVWNWYAHRRDGVRACTPNPGHVALADFQRRRPGVVTLVTQNVDDLHQRAGSVGVIQLHGDLFAEHWLRPCRERAAQGRDCATDAAEPGEPPRCTRCGNLVRPGVVWFGESLPPGAMAAAETAARDCEVMLVVGTSGAVWPAAGLAGTARRAGAHVVIVNPAESEIDDEASLCLRGTAATLLPKLLAA